VTSQIPVTQPLPASTPDYYETQIQNTNKNCNKYIFYVDPVMCCRNLNSEWLTSRNFFRQGSLLWQVYWKCRRRLIF